MTVLFSRSFFVSRTIPRAQVPALDFYPLAFFCLKFVFVSRAFLLSFITPSRSQRCFNNCICYQVSLWKANLRKPWKPDGLVFKFDPVVSPPSGLKSCSLSLKLFQFPVRRHLNIWRFWSFWFICRKYRKMMRYRKILVCKNLLCIILPPIKEDVF